ncbi:hypothetical protein [Halovivax limisalsi]|uniref:hypothetical protein n=1 Tax=Halovivax limisalsi TaxID=1453760 RepID=UPI001FFD3A5A|nr:hypothetical protein [Halovivax limisalsi]
MRDRPVSPLSPALMDHSPSPDPADPTAAFRTRLADALLSAYARGATVETTHEIDGPCADAPGWRVTVEKVPPERRRYEPALLEEGQASNEDAGRTP